LIWMCSEMCRTRTSVPFPSFTRPGFPPCGCVDAGWVAPSRSVWALTRHSVLQKAGCTTPVHFYEHILFCKEHKCSSLIPNGCFKTQLSS
jgi:hypothetical protein